MAQWTSEYAILRDLAVAQGRLPVGIEGTVGAGDKPPSLNITEETEEEFFKHCTADIDVTAPPDLGLIKQMLDMVRDINVSSDDEDYTNKAVVISKLNPLSSEFVPNTNQTSTPISNSPNKEVTQEKAKEKPKKRQRNVAVESILKALKDGKQNENTEIAPEPMKLLKPNDFISKNNIEEACEISGDNHKGKISFVTNQSDTEMTKDTALNDVSPTALEKVNGWLKSQTENPLPKKTPKVTLEATNMFKRKSVMEKVKKVETVKSPTSSNSGEYKPSVLANEYYQKYVERSKFKESVRDDIWTRAERRMKEIEEKRREQAAIAVATPVTSSPELVNEDSSVVDFPMPPVHPPPITQAKMYRCVDAVSLPQHRHLLAGRCVVCEVLCAPPDDQHPFDHLLPHIFE